ncbi:DUF1642 domain-containing protein, partial [Lactococcus lactis subsp. lactis]|uniref:DUF1642 domain-containing protein n=1 Tax=Lactococcus lactis TaxID=1358 RepID=UPI00223AE02E
NKVPCKFELTTEAEYKQTTLINHFKNWHSDEEFQELLDKYSNLNDHYEKEVIRSSKLESQLISREKQVIELREADKAQGKEIIQLKSQLQQQALPVVPDCVAVQIERVNNSNGNFATLGLFDWNHEAKPDYTKWIHENVFDFMRACTIGYTVEKPQLFYIELPNVYGLKNKVSVSKVENGTIVEFSNGKNYALKLTEQEIKSIDERYWQFAVPVEDGE